MKTYKATEWDCIMQQIYNGLGVYLFATYLPFYLIVYKLLGIDFVTDRTTLLLTGLVLTIPAILYEVKTFDERVMYVIEVDAETMRLQYKEGFIFNSFADERLLLKDIEEIKHSYGYSGGAIFFPWARTDRLEIKCKEDVVSRWYTIKLRSYPEFEELAQELNEDLAEYKSRQTQAG